MSKENQKHKVIEGTVPHELDGAKVLLFLQLGPENKVTGKCRHRRDGKELPAPKNLAICNYRENAGYYLFYCDADWKVQTDTYHDTVDAAIKQAAFEFEGAGSGWSNFT